MYSNWHEAITTNFALGKVTSKGWHTLSCPVCHDRQVRGGFKFTEDGFGYNCFRGSCNHRISFGGMQDIERQASNILKLFRSVGVPDDDWSHLLYDSANDTPVELPKEKILRDPSPVALPHGATALLESNPNSAVVTHVVDYLINRGVDPTKPFYVTTRPPHKDTPDFRNRCIIPFYFRNELVFYQGVWVDPKWFTKIKYLNVPDVDRDIIFYNMDELDRKTNDPIFILEGVFDAMWFTNGVSVLSNNITDQQILRLNSTRRQKIVIPDNDRAGARMVDTAIREGWDVSFPDWFGVHKDLDDAIRAYGKVRTAQEIMRSICQSDFEKELVSDFLRSVKKKGFTK